MSQGYLYILRSEKSGRFYVGSTIDPERRLHEHNIGHVRATRGKGPWVHAKIVTFSTAKQARQAEYHIKRQKRRSAIDTVIDGIYPWSEDMRPLDPEF